MTQEIHIDIKQAQCLTLTLNFCHSLNRETSELLTLLQGQESPSHTVTHHSELTLLQGCHRYTMDSTALATPLLFCENRPLSDGEVSIWFASLLPKKVMSA